MEKIQLIHPEGKKAVSMEKEKYEALKGLLIEFLSGNGSSTHSEIKDGVNKLVKSRKIAFKGSVNWHLEWVKLDLESRKLIERITDSKPVKYHLL